MENYISRKELAALLGSDSSVVRRMADPTFPLPIIIAGRKQFFRKDELDAWFASPHYAAH